MVRNANDPAAALLLKLQSGVPLDARPFLRVGEALGLTEDDVLQRVRELFDRGVARRFGAVFDSRSLGYASTLCAADVPERGLEEAAARLTPHPGVTHCYQRDGHPSLWFTLTAPADALASELARLAEALAPCQVLNLPALRKFKIEAIFGREDEEGPPRAGPAAKQATPAEPRTRPPLTERERRVVRSLQGSLPLVADPFGAVAHDVDYDPADLLDLLARWERDGVIRRIGLIVRHQRLGFSANSMCVWPVPEDRIEAAGRAAARSPHVTHCYERPSCPSFPYNLYAMVHAKTRAEAGRIFEQITAEAALSPGRMLWSVREFKKSSPLFFSEPAPQAPWSVGHGAGSAEASEGCAS